MFQGVMAGDIPLMGLGTEPKNIPVAANKDVERINICTIPKHLHLKSRTIPPLTPRHADAGDVCWDLHAVLALLSI